MGGGDVLEQRSTDLAAAVTAVTAVNLSLCEREFVCD
jgi:hypothetical protein